jgi:mono/diheme cytochrome c family protein
MRDRRRAAGTEADALVCGDREEGRCMKVLKVIGGLIVFVVVVAVGFYLWASQTAKSKYEKQWTAHTAEFPMPFPLDSAGMADLRQQRIAAGASAKAPLAGVDLAAAANDRAVRHGERLLKSRLGCVGCHGETLGGGVIVDLPIVGHWVAPNLTLGSGGVTSGFSAHDWDLAVRHGIRHTGQTSSMPCNDFVGLADHDLSDVIAYVRSRPPVDRLMGPVKFGPVFTFLVALDPSALPAYSIDHLKAHPVEPPKEEVSADLGEYIVQNCRGCHNAKLSGGKLQGDPNMPIVANITPDSTGLKAWSEADFMRALREGKRPDGRMLSNKMPWPLYQNMNDVELKSIWTYLQTVPAVRKGVK